MLKESETTIKDKQPLKCPLNTGFVQQNGLILVSVFTSGEPGRKPLEQGKNKQETQPI